MCGPQNAIAALITGCATWPNRGLELVNGAPCGACDVAFFGEALGDGAAGSVAGSNHQNGFLVCHVQCCVDE
jgi:hypothetical protein